MSERVRVQVPSTAPEKPNKIDVTAKSSDLSGLFLMPQMPKSDFMFHGYFLRFLGFVQERTLTKRKSDFFETEKWFFIA